MNLKVIKLTQELSLAIKESLSVVTMEAFRETKAKIRSIDKLEII